MNTDKVLVKTREWHKQALLLQCSFIQQNHVLKYYLCHFSKRSWRWTRSKNDRINCAKNNFINIIHIPSVWSRSHIFKHLSFICFCFFLTLFSCRHVVMKWFRFKNISELFVLYCFYCLPAQNFSLIFTAKPVWDNINRHSLEFSILLNN